MRGCGKWPASLADYTLPDGAPVPRGTQGAPAETRHRARTRCQQYLLVDACAHEDSLPGPRVGSEACSGRGQGCTGHARAARLRVKARREPPRHPAPCLRAHRTVGRAPEQCDASEQRGELGDGPKVNEPLVPGRQTGALMERPPRRRGRGRQLRAAGLALVGRVRVLGDDGGATAEQQCHPKYLHRVVRLFARLVDVQVHCPPPVGRERQVLRHWCS